MRLAILLSLLVVGCSAADDVPLLRRAEGAFERSCARQCDATIACSGACDYDVGTPEDCRACRARKDACHDACK